MQGSSVLLHKIATFLAGLPRLDRQGYASVRTVASRHPPGWSGGAPKWRSVLPPRRFFLAIALAILSFIALLARHANGAEPDITMWGQPACSHCAAAGTFLDELQQRRTDVRIVRHDITRDPKAFQELRFRSEEAGVDVLGLPSFAVRGHFIVGFDSAETTGVEIEKRLERMGHQKNSESSSALAPGFDTPGVSEDEEAPPPGTIDLPAVGRVSSQRLGLPLFTILVGLVDGFNPCAMWVLLFLLSLLVNIKSRPRMIAIAGSFVVVSGLAYYAFMAAWLNVFVLVGFSRAVQTVLGAVALLIGGVNIKDFFAFQKGITLGIPERAKPGIYARVRAIVHAENLVPAIVGATMLAVLVNVVELVCTAGLPALYTQILVQQGTSPAQRYAYLALYDLAYMFDDSIMVAIAVVTLGKRKLQERGGRWLKLLSGTVILVLGALLLFAPGALVW